MIRVIGKGDKERVIPIAETIFEPLRQYTKNMQSSDRVFPISSPRLGDIITRYARQAGLNDVHPHSLRHFFATQLVESGANLKQIQELLGHESIATTSLYLDVIPKHLSDAVDKLPNLWEK